MRAGYQAWQHEQQRQGPDQYLLQQLAAEQAHEHRPDQQHRGMVTGEALAGAVLELPSGFQMRVEVAQVDGVAEHHRRAVVLPAHGVHPFREQRADQQQQDQGGEETKEGLAHLARLEHPVAADQQAEQDQADDDIERTQAANGPDVTPGAIVGKWPIEQVKQPFVESQAEDLAKGP
ncbi:hypothetical protein D3C80_1324140 [compost metagenome]